MFRVHVMSVTCVVMFILLDFFVFPAFAFAQFDLSTIAQTYAVPADAVPGDIMSFDPHMERIELSHIPNDPNLFGVFVAEPVVELRTLPNGSPIATSGSALVNVTTIQGPISAGDRITTSSIPGKGERASPAASYIIGTALDAFPSPADVVVYGTASSTVYAGTIRVLLNTHSLIASSSGIAAEVHANDNPPPIQQVTGIPTPIAQFIKYVLAALVSIGSIYGAFRSFGSNMKDSIISIGRNPLAKASIESMVVLNTILIVLISAAGLFLGVMILFFPV